MPDQFAREVIWERRYKAGYILRREIWEGTPEMGPPVEMVSAYNLNGQYIGDSKTAYRLCVKRGIYPELRTRKSGACSVGKAAGAGGDGSWYGWSHRAIKGGFKTRRAAAAFAESVS